MKNYDPQMHTAEHVLNQTMVRLFGCGRSFSNHLERKKSKCDYHFTRPLMPDEERMIADQVNDVLSAGLEVSATVLSRDEAAKFFNLNRLPEAQGEEVRIVRVGEYDACPCIGDHVANTLEVGTFVLISSSFENDVLRLRFKLNRPN